MRPKPKSEARTEARFCPWCETKYRPAPDHAGPICPDCRAELLEQSKEVLVDLLGHVTGVNVIAIALLRDNPEILEELGLWNAPKREGFTRRTLTAKELARQLARKRQTVH